jgi:hypothetical protein
MAQEREGSSEEQLTSRVGETVFVYDEDALAPGKVPGRRNPFAYLGTGEEQSIVLPAKPCTLEQRLHSLYGNIDSDAFHDGTLHHEIARRVRRTTRE